MAIPINQMYARAQVWTADVQTEQGSTLLRFGILGLFVIWCLWFGVSTASAATLGGASITQPVNNLGLVGYWPMEEGGGTVTADRTIQKSNGTLGNAPPTWTLGKLGKGLNFTAAANNYVQIPRTVAIEPTGVVSIAGWFKKTSLTQSQSYLIGKRVSAGTAPYNSYAFAQGGGADHTYSFGIGNVLLGNSGSNLTTPSVDDLLWHHLVGTYDGATQNLYMDGSLVASAQTTGSLLYAGLDFWVGGSNAYGGTCCFNGSIDDVRIYNRALSAGEAKALYSNQSVRVGSASAQNINAPLNKGLVGYWPLDGATTNWTAGTTRDLSGSGNTGTLINLGVNTAPVAGKVGQALSFNGITSYIQVPSHSSINISTNKISGSAWVKLRSAPTPSDGPIFAKGSGSYYFDINSSRTIQIYTYGTTPQAWLTSVGAVPLNVWTHVAFTYDGSYIKVYINGVLDNIEARTGNITGNSTILAIGAVGLGGGVEADRFFPGSIDEVRIYNRPLSADEVKELYNMGGAKLGSSAAAGQSGGLVGHWTMDGSKINWSTNVMQDSSGQGNAGQLISLGTTSAPVAGKVGQALKFNGASSYINAGNISGPSGATTIAAWVYKTADVAWASILDRYDSETLDCLSLGFDSTNGKKLMFMWDNAAPFNNRVGANSDIPTGRWVHVAASSNGSVVTFYVNGVTDGTGAVGAPCTTGSMYMGVNFAGGDEYLNGSLDDVRLYNRALSAAEVQALYNSTK